MIKLALVCLALLLASNAVAFAPGLPIPHATSLHLADEATEVSPFDAYEQTAAQTTVEYKDFVTGTGPASEDGNLLKVKYEGRLMASNKKFDVAEEFVFRIGEGRVAPGFSAGVAGMKVGGKRQVKIPPNLAYGDQWFKGVIPPSSHLDFDVELLEVAQSQQEELMMQLNDFGVARLLGLIACFGVLAITPMLPS
ncbi:FK506-binding protein 4 [Seminavis robusta]|uniref:peptidylprolyl isomerase n=1 Tax=Seminavis robusta TaxID=568900 RepID=A0A9N8F422_9STRA|nr:FK506-binding protein 4 [Seminavis robusta]|eukprot:Sro3213_g345370.1 FK506-binding protein 4 (195) ;mRNA; f:2783-3367